MSIILKTAARGLVPLILLFSIFILLRGHNEPGGGFIGGMVAGGGFALYMLGYGVQTARRAVRVPPGIIVAMGLLTAASSAIVPLFLGRPLLTGLWWDVPAPMVGVLPLSTTLLFDIGVYLLVTGMTLTILFELSEAD